MNIRENTSGGMRVDLASVIDSAPFVGVPLFVTALSFVMMTIDGYDLQSMAFAAPALAAQWHVKRELLGPVLAASIVGMAFGSIGFGWLGDRIGRKLSLAGCIALLCLGSLVQRLFDRSRSIGDLPRHHGLGLGRRHAAGGGAHRRMDAEPQPQCRGVPLGGTIGAALAARIIPAFGWKSVFIVGAVLPLVLLAIVLLRLPESPKYLARSHEHRSRLARALNRLVKQQRFTGAENFVVEEPPVQGSGWLFTLLRPPYLATTLLIWCAFICNSLALYSFVNWLPTVLSSSGMSLTQALHGSLLFNFGGIVGALCGSALISRYGSRRVGSLIALAGAIAACLVGRDG